MYYIMERQTFTIVAHNREQVSSFLNDPHAFLTLSRNGSVVGSNRATRGIRGGPFVLDLYVSADERGTLQARVICSDMNLKG